MSKKTAQAIRLIYGIALSLLLIATGILLMISCVNIYKIGSRPFTPEHISAAFAKIAIPVWITVGATVVGLILHWILPAENSKPRALKDKKLTLAQLQNKLAEKTGGEASTLAAIQKEQKLRILLRVIAIILCVASALPALLYTLNFNNFSTDYNASVIAACTLILPCALISMGVCVALVYLEAASVSRQLAHVKAALAESKGNATAAPKAEQRRSHSKAVLGVRITLAVVALALIVAGILNGGMADVLAKAVNICTECIGLG